MRGVGVNSWSIRDSKEEGLTSPCQTISATTPSSPCPHPQAAAEGEGPLADGFGRVHKYLRISVTDRCNLRCLYCMPRTGIVHRGHEEILRLDEITRLSRLFARMGINKIRLTGGEPLVRSGIEHLVRELAGIDGVATLGMTTNGVFLGDRAASLRKAGLTHLNISLDTLRPERFVQVASGDCLDKVFVGINSALAAGFVPVKLNVVVIGGINDDEVLDFAELTKERPISVRFIEFMPFHANDWGRDRFVPTADLRSALEERFRLVPVVLPAGYPAPVAREFHIDGHQGSIGFIASMSNHFCSGCNRLRLTADGALKSCLFYPAETSLRDPMRAGADDTAIMELIRSTLLGKYSAHPPLESLGGTQTQSMIEIGG